MKKITFGTLRFIELYSSEDGEHVKRFSNYIKALKLDQKISKPYNIIGSVNGMTPLVATEEQTAEVIIVEDSLTNEFVTIANSRAQLDEILSKIYKIWQPYSSEMFLPRNEDTRKQYKEAVSYLKNIAGIDAGYWIDFAFKELDIRYEV